jgi:hypothetical protein
VRAAEAHYGEAEPAVAINFCCRWPTRMNTKLPGLHGRIDTRELSETPLGGKLAWLAPSSPVRGRRPAAQDTSAAGCWRAFRFWAGLLGLRAASLICSAGRQR